MMASSVGPSHMFTYVESCKKDGNHNLFVPHLDPGKEEEWSTKR